MILEQLKELAVDISALTLDPANARQHSERNLVSIENSLKRFGQRKPVVVQKNGMVVRAGNGTVVAAKRLGWKEVAAVIIDEDNLEATSFAIADNRTGDLSDWDYNTLSELMSELDKQDPSSLLDMGWTKDELDTFLADNTFEIDLGPSDDGFDDGDGFADSSQFKDSSKAIFIIEASAEQADDMEFKAAVESLCSEYEVTYKVRLA